MAADPVDYFATADPSWYPRVLRTLFRDYPRISDEVWSTAITENAIENVEKKRRREDGPDLRS